MLPDWMKGGSSEKAEPKPKGKPKPKPEAEPLPSWLTSATGGSSSEGAASTPFTQMVGEQLRKPPIVFDQLGAIQEELGITAGALTPAAEQAKKEKPRGEREDRKFTEGEKGETRKITTARYENMSPRQRAAVDFNTMLFEATQADRRENKLLQGNATKVQNKIADLDEYLNKLRGMGVDGKPDSNANAGARAGSPLERVGAGYGGQALGTGDGTVSMTDAAELDRLFNQATKARSGLTDKLDKLTPEEYDDTYRRIFGRGAEVSSYAPNTLALLEQLGYRSGVGKGMDFTEASEFALGDRRALMANPNNVDNQLSLEEFRDLQTGISFRDLDNYIPGDDGGPMVNHPTMNDVEAAASARGLLAMDLTRRTMDLQSQLAKGNKILQDFQTAALADREDERLDLGASRVEPVSTRLLPGFGEGSNDPDRPNLNDEIRKAFEVLSNVKGPKFEEALNSWIAYMDQNKINRDDFFTYANKRIENAEVYGSPLTDNGKTSYTPEKLRKALGIVPAGGK